MTIRGRTNPERLLSAGDIELAATMLFLLPVAWLLPSRWWSAVCQWLASWRPGPLAQRRVREASHIPDVLVELSGLPAIELANARMAIFYEELLQALRLHRPGGWSPTIHVVGIEHVESAKREDRGVILWYSLAFRSLVLKRAFAGSLVQLSRPTHPFSSTRLGMRLLNPVRVKVEDRLLKRRVIIRDESRAEAMRALDASLRAGDVVAISFDSEARQIVPQPMFGGTLGVPTGPLNLARVTGASLLPVFVVRVASDEYRIDIEPSIEFEGPARESHLEAGAQVYAGLLETYIRRYPLLWPEWPRVWRHE